MRAILYITRIWTQASAKRRTRCWKTRKHGAAELLQQGVSFGSIGVGLLYKKKCKVSMWHFFRFCSHGGLKKQKFIFWGVQGPVLELLAEIGSFPILIFFTGSVDLKSWTLTHPEQWTTREVLDWIFSVVQLIEDFQFDTFRGEKFNKLSGKELCSMSREDFCELDPMYGDKLFSIMNKMLKTGKF